MVDIQTFGDWTLLTDEEIQTTLRETETKDLAVAFIPSSGSTRYFPQSPLFQRLSNLRTTPSDWGELHY